MASITSSGAYAATGAFYTTAGQIIGPNGSPFVARGIDVMEGNQPTLSQLQSDFPGVNFVRLAIYDFASPAALLSYVNSLTAAGIVVELEDHSNSNGSNAGGGSGTIFTGSQLTTELNWYSSIATAFKANPYVWFGTNNEPSEIDSSGNTDPAALSTWQQQTYNAVRATGNTSPIMVEMNGGNTPSSFGQGYTPSVYAGMTNIVWDVHYYGWLTNYSTDQATVTANLAADIAQSQTLTSANGKVPVIIGEYGNSTNGSTVDANGNQVISAVQNSGFGSAAWAWGTGYPADGLTTASGGLSSYGQQVATWIAAGGTVPPVVPPVVPPKTPSANDSVLLATATGSLTDASGNAWTIVNGVVDENGAAAGVSSGVTELAYVNATIWQENASSLWWSWSGTAWSTGAGTSTSPLPAPPPAKPTASANDTVVLAGSSAAITDAAGNTWTLAGGVVNENGAAAGLSAGVTEIAYVNGTVWQENASALWWSWTGTAWSTGSGTTTSPLPAPPPVTPPAPVASPNDTMVLAGSTAAITDASGNKWTITSTGQVAVNGVADTTTANVTELAYVNKVIWQENTAKLWWGETSPTAGWAPSAGTATSPLPVPVAIASTTASSTVTQSQISVVATAGTHLVFIKGSGDFVSLSGGADTITDTGSGNTYILPAAGKGTDSFTNNILTIGDTLDLKVALAATDWSGTASTLAKYLTVTDTAKGATVSIAPTSGGIGVAIASIGGATTANLTSVLAHSFT
nr:cellulase family glycosylhydrolase [uncultured Rhodopila sp.]